MQNGLLASKYLITIANNEIFYEFRNTFVSTPKNK